MSKKIALTVSPEFEKFIKDRDHALEDILFKYQIAIARIVSVLKTRTEEIVVHLSTKSIGREHAKMNREIFQKRLEPWFQMGIIQAHSLIKQMRGSVYALSYAGQAEAIGRALRKQTKANLSRSDITAERERSSIRGGNSLARVELSFHRLLRDVVDAFQASQVLESPSQETLERVQRVFPKEKKISKRPKNRMAKVREAERKPEDKVTLSSGVIDPETWDKLLTDYRDEYLPFGSAPGDQIFYASNFRDEVEADSIQGYDWEVSNELMNDFVQSVRNGEDDNSEENGMDDGVWIAVIDGKTDECCSVRDGLLISEIRKKLDDGDDMGGCDAEISPAHPFCRCRIAPATKEIVHTDKPEVDYAGFDDWLENKE